MLFDMDMKHFWEVNKKCLELTPDIQRVPVRIRLTDDWICDYLKLDNAKYYSNFEYQQDNRQQAGEIVKKALGIEPSYGIDFGVIMDASIYGGEVHYERKATPTLKPVINDPEDIDVFIERMNEVDILSAGLVPMYLEWHEKINSRYGVKLKYGGAIKGCCTMLGQLCGITNFLTWIMTEPEQIDKLVACWLETSKRYIDLMREETGYDDEIKGFSFASDVAGMMSLELYEKHIMYAEKELYDRYASGNEDTRYYHADSHMLHLLDGLKKIGVNQVNIDPYISPDKILEKLPDCVVFGQVPPLHVLLNGTQEDVIECVKRDIEQAGPGRHLVVTTAGSINPGTTFENIRALCYAVERYGYIY